jgi:hypothetical protein
MSIDLSSSVKKTSQWAFSSPFLNGVLGSSLFVALVIAIVMVLLIMFMYPAKHGTPFMLVVKMFIYMFFISMVVIFLHDGVAKAAIAEEYRGKELDDLARGIDRTGKDPVYGNTPVVRPRTGAGEPAAAVSQQTPSPPSQPIKPVPPTTGGLPVEPLPSKPVPVAGGNPYM